MYWTPLASSDLPSAATRACRSVVGTRLMQAMIFMGSGRGKGAERIARGGECREVGGRRSRAGARRSLSQAGARRSQGSGLGEAALFLGGDSLAHLRVEAVAEVDLAHLRVLHELARGALAQDAALVDDVGAVGRLQRLA